MINLITFGTATEDIGIGMKKIQPEVFEQFHVDDYIPALVVNHTHKTRNHSEYEEIAQSIDLDLTNGTNLFILNPSSDVSGALLVLLEKTERKDNQVICILSDFDFLSKTQIEQTKFVVNVLQELARSGAIGQLVLINQKYIEKYIPNLSIKDYYKQIDGYIATTLSTWLWCQEVDSLINNSIDRIETTRISTLGFYDLEENKIHLFSDLTFTGSSGTFPLEIDFYFILDKETIENGNELMNQIKQSIKNKKQQEFEGASIGFKILEGPANFTLTHVRTSKIQSI